MTNWRGDKGTAAERGYGSRWRKARLTFLAANPLCVMCAKLGRDEAATRVDHITPHRGDQRLFWDRSNWQALCQPHHDRTKQAQERSGIVKGTDATGRPLDPDHPWNRASRA